MADTHSHSAEPKISSPSYQSDDVKKKSKKRKTKDHEEYVPSSVTRRICFWGKEEESYQITWFVFDVSINLIPPPQQVRDKAIFDHDLLHQNDEKDSVQVLAPVFSSGLPSDHSRAPLLGNSFSVLGDYVFSIGGGFIDGDEYRTNLVHYFDHNTAKEKHNLKNNCWEQAPSMITPRDTPQVITLNNKIYVFGCCGKVACKHKPRCRVWAEFFDGESKSWSPLPKPQFEDSLVICSPNHMENSSITKTFLVIADNKYVNEFNIETNCWTRLYTFANLGFLSSRELPYYPKETKDLLVLVDNVLYWFENLVYAYDILEDKLYSGPLQDFAFQRGMRTWYNTDCDCVGAKGEYKPAIIHLGGLYFCLISSLPDEAISCEFSKEDTPCRIHCLTIKVSRTKKSNFLSARAVSCQSFPIDDHRIFVDGRFMIGC